MSTEERDTQIEDQVDFTAGQEINQEELTPEVSDFDQTETPEVEQATPEVEASEETPVNIEIESPSIPVESPETTNVEPAIEQPEMGTQETSPLNRVMRFEDFVNNRD